MGMMVSSRWGVWEMFSRRVCMALDGILRTDRRRSLMKLELERLADSPLI